MEHLITTVEAAKLLDVTPGRVRQLILGSVLKSEKHGRDHLLKREDVVRFGKLARKPGRPKKPE